MMTIEISAIFRQSWELVRAQRTGGHISLLHSLWNLKGVTLFIDFVVLKAISNIFKLMRSIETRVARTIGCWNSSSTQFLYGTLSVITEYNLW